MSTFDRAKYLINLKGKEYLPVSARLIWFRMEHPTWSIVTEAHEINTEKNYAIFRATIMDDTGRILATATKFQSARTFGDFIEKAETGSVGRALGMCGFGTENDPEFDEEHRIVDTPQSTRNKPVPAMVAARLAFAEHAKAEGYVVYDGEKPSNRLVGDLFLSITRINPETATVEQWKQAARSLDGDGGK